MLFDRYVEIQRVCEVRMSCNWEVLRMVLDEDDIRQRKGNEC